MAGSIVQQQQGFSTTTGTSFTTTALGPLTVGNTLVLVVASDSTVHSIFGWNTAVTSIENNALYVFYKTIAAGEPTSVTVTKNAAAGHTYWIAELAGLPLSSQVDKVASRQSAGSSTSWPTGTTAATTGDTFNIFSLSLWHQNTGGTLVTGFGFGTIQSDQVTTSSGNTETVVATLNITGSWSGAQTATLSTAAAHGASSIVAFKILGPATPVAVSATSSSAVSVTRVFTAAGAGTVYLRTPLAISSSSVKVTKATALHLTATSDSVIVGLCNRQKLITVTATKASTVRVQLVHSQLFVTVTALSDSVVTTAVGRRNFARQLVAAGMSGVTVSLVVTRSITPTPISYGVETWLAEVEMALLSGDKDERNLLSSPIDETTNQVVLTGPLEGVQAGAYLGVDLEVMYVVSVNDAGQAATVIRGTLASPATPHPQDTVVYVNPRFTRWQMFKAINAELRDLSAPPNMIFQVKNFVTTTQPVAQTYAVPAENTDIISLIELRYSFPDANRSWPRVTRNRFSVLRNMPSSAFVAGMAIRLDEAVYPGRPLSVTYAAPLGELVNLTDDVLTQTGIPATASDIPPLGAAARLMGVREAKRSFTESAMDSRRAAEVPSGAAARGAGVILQMLNVRIRSEALRLKSQHPEMV